MDRFFHGIANHPWRVLALTLGVTVLAALACVDLQTGKSRLQIDPSIERLLPPADADRAVFERVRGTFGDTDIVLVAAQFDPVWTAENLARIERFTQALQDLPHVRSVASLATVPNLMAQGEDLDVTTFTQQAQRDPAVVAEFPRQMAANPIYRGSLVSDDGRVAAFAISLADVDEDAFRATDFPGLIRAAAAATLGDAAPVWITGSAIAKAATVNALLDTLAFTLPAIFVLIVVVLSLAFRSLRVTLTATATIALALVWTLGTGALLGMPINLVTAIVPPLVATLGLSYTVHVLSEFLSMEEPESRNDLAAILKRIFLPLLLTGATSVAGFFALMPQALPAIFQFAALSALGVTYAAILAFAFLPVMLATAGCTRRHPPGAALFKVLAQRLADLDITHRRAIIAVSLALLPLALMYASRIEVGTAYITDFKEDAPVRQDYEAINRAFNGASVIAILIETYVDDALLDPERVREIERLQDWLREQPEVGAVVSFVDHLKLINQSLNEGDAAFFAVPDDPAAIKQLLVFGGNEEIKNVIDARFRTALISVRINIDHSRGIRDLTDRIEGRLALLPKPLNAEVTGSPVLATRTVDAIGGGQLLSFSISFLVIWALLSVLFTSPRAGFVAMLPNVIPVVVYFGILGGAGIGLNPTTSLIASIVLGIAADDTIHYMVRFNADARAKASEAAAARSALAHVLRPITLTMIALCLGFLVFVGSEMRNQQQFGVLAALTLFLAWVMNITLTPALGSLVRIVTLWDLLRLDLGHSPQYTIPLLSGLSNRQARVFALLSRIEEVPAGTRVITEGDEARDIYVIVDGELDVFVDRNGERKRLATMSRGATMGETGFFAQRRTANVDARTRARLLRFDSQDLERLRRRHPRIAATVFRNLNRIQAERIARTTAMIQ